MAFGVGGPTAAAGVGQTSGFSAMDPLVIGTVTFFDEETPDDLTIELSQVWAFHINIGGSRDAQALGPNPGDITWRGRLWAGNVLYRYQQLKTMENAAVPVPLSYLDQSYSVIIKNVKQLIEHRWRGDYEITVSILSDTSGQYSQNPPNGIDGQINQITQAAQATLTQLKQQDAAGSAAMRAQFNALFYVIETAGILSQLTTGTLQDLIDAAAAAYEAALAYSSGVGTGTGTQTGSSPTFTGPSVSSTPNGSSPTFLMGEQLASYAALIIKNLSAGQAPALIVQQGGSGDLFDLATQYYGDPSLAFPLASANGLITPILSSTEVYQIVLPPLQSSNQPAST